MKKTVILVLILKFGNIFSQSFLNGGFEYTVVLWDAINMTNTQFDSIVYNSYAFGNNGNLDIIVSNDFCNITAQEGNFYVALTGGGSDAFSMKLSSPLDSGEWYTINYYDKFCDLGPGSNIHSSRVAIGISDSSHSFGTTIFTSQLPTLAWTGRSFNFQAPISGQYITVKAADGAWDDTWIQVDHFVISNGVGLEPMDSKEILIYPNPTDGLFTVDLEMNGIVEMIDIFGKKVILPISNNNVDMTKLSNGIYTAVFRNSSSTFTKRIVKI